MAGTTAATRESWDGVGQVRLSQPGQTTTVLFTRLPDGQTARVAATAGEADLIDMWGERETITAEDGVFTVELPGALCLQTIADYCMIGGTTYYLIQAADGRAPATGNRPTEESATTTTPRPSATAAPSPTNEPAMTPITAASPAYVAVTVLLQVASLMHEASAAQALEAEEVGSFLSANVAATVLSPVLLLVSP